MRRPSIACYRAVQPPNTTTLDYVWISDDLLSAAVSRFFRIICPHQRRYGSHVPGPLEAQRRATKRRMALQANVELPGGLPSSLFNFAAWFGSRQAGEPRWKYEPPSLQTREPPDISFDIPPPTPPARPSLQYAEPVSDPPDSQPRPSPPTLDTSDWLPNKLEREIDTIHHLENHRNEDDLDATIDRTQFTSTKDGTIYSDSSSADEHARNAPPSLEGVIALENWARDSAGDQTPLFEALLNEDAPVEVTESLLVDVDACFQNFRNRMDDTFPAMYEDRPGMFLTSSYLTCCPPHAGAGKFCVLAFQYLAQSPWRGRYAAELLRQPSVRLPDVGSPDGLQFLQILEEEYLAPWMPRTLVVHNIYQRLAQQVQMTLASSSSTPKAMTVSILADIFVNEVNLRLLIRGLWDSAQWNTKCGLDSYTLSLLQELSLGLSGRRLRRSLRSIWDVLRTNLLQAPQHLDNLIVAYVKDSSKLSMALKLLEIVPPSLLQDWIASMPATANELQPDPQMVRGSPRYLHMWFGLFYRLDMRTKVRTDELASLCQSASSNFIRTHFENGYPPWTLVVALLWGLLGHPSFAGKASLALVEYIESTEWISPQENQKATSVNGMLARLMSDLTARSLPNHGVLELLIPYVEGHKSFHSISNLLERLVTNKTKLSSTTFLESYTDLLLEEISTESEITRLGYNLASFNRLLNAQLALGVADVHTKARFEAIRSHRLFCHILARANDASVVPLAYRNLTANIPKEVQADLVHQFAFQYATDRTRSIQQNWRSIRYLYFYLRIHDMAIRPLFTRTVVSVCITRPLAEKRFVAQKKAVWVCRLVAEVEGEAAARHVEQYFWAWRGDLILQARRELVRLGVYDLARVTTMERLKLLTVVPKRTPECEEDVDTHGHGLAEDRC